MAIQCMRTDMTRQQQESFSRDLTASKGKKQTTRGCSNETLSARRMSGIQQMAQLGDFLAKDNPIHEIIWLESQSGFVSQEQVRSVYSVLRRIHNDLKNVTIANNPEEDLKNILNYLRHQFKYEVADKLASQWLLEGKIDCYVECVVGLMEAHERGWHDLGISLVPADVKLAREGNFIDVAGSYPIHVLGQLFNVNENHIDEVVRPFEGRDKMGIVYLIIGHVLEKDKRYVDAQLQYQKAYQIRPNHPAILNSLGSIYAFQGQFNEAEKFLLQAIKNDPNYVTAHENLAAVYSKMGRWAEAMQEFETAASIDEKFGMEILSMDAGIASQKLDNANKNRENAAIVKQEIDKQKPH